jgi:cell division inhibitor SepF
LGGWYVDRSGQEGETMSALHRLKAYFGMVPTEEFDAAEFADYHLDHRSAHPESNDYGEGVTTPTGHHAPPRLHSTRYPSWTTEPSWSREPSSSREPSWNREPRAAESRVTDPCAGQTPVRGSLAIDTAASTTRSTVRQPVAPHRVPPVLRADPFADDLLGDDTAHPLARIVTLHPHNYNEARPVGERYREGNPVIMNLTGMEDRDAKRLVDFAAGLAFALRGSIDKVTNKVFLLSPPNVEVSAEDRRRIAEGHLFS